MLEKIGLPSKPSLRGNTWVVDASHCQGCSSQFTFINRKHHCRRCGGIFCSSCTQLRMVLRGQGDSPVRICEPCKKLEEAARFEMRHGHKNRAGRGGPKLSSKDEDEVLNTILGSDEKDSSSGKEFKILAGSQRSSSNASCSNIQEATTQDEGAILRSLSVGVTDMASTTPDELRQQALDEKKKYKTLKAEGKSEEALRAFKRGKELERQAGALDLQLRKSRRKALSSISTNDISKSKEEPAESSKINRLSPQVSKDDDLSSELKKLGWSDLDLHDAEKKPVKVSLEGELSSLLGEVSKKTNTEKVANGLDKSEVIAIKRNALALKREGKLAEAKEELKRAKILEKQIEEQEFLIDADDSDDELSALIRSMDSDKQNLSSRKAPDVNFNFENLVGIADNLGVDNFDVSDEDMDDPDITVALESVGWTEDMDETNLDSNDSLGSNSKTPGHMTAQNEPTFPSAEIKKPTHAAPKSKLMIQRELLALKKRALALRREGKADEADEELMKGKFLEQQLEEMDQSSKGKITQVNSGNKNAKSEISDVGDEVEDVTEQDMNDPSFASLLNNLGWKDEENEHVQSHQKGNTKTHEITNDSSVAHVHSGKQLETSRKSKAEVQRELLGLKRKALALRRQGEADEAEEVLEMAKVLEAQLSQMEAPKQEVPAEVNKTHNDETCSSLNIAADNGAVGTSLKDIISNQLRQTKPSEGLERKDQMIEKPEGKSENQSSDELNHSQVMASTNNQSSPQKEILAHKKAALTLKREGKLVEAKEELRQAKILEKSLQDSIQKASTSFSSSEVSSSNNTVTGQKEKSPVAAPKMSSRDRFKLQQESLSHKRQALKLRREGRTEEAEAEFELAKALEIQLEELNSSDLNKPSTNLAEPVDDVGIEDLLDPQLLSALRAIGIDDTTNVSRVPENSEVSKSAAGKIDNSVGERTQLEERIKAEKVKALTLKRSGKQPEAMEALRRARMLEKKLASLAS